MDIVLFVLSLFFFFDGVPQEHRVLSRFVISKASFKSKKIDAVF